MLTCPRPAPAPRAAEPRGGAGTPAALEELVPGLRALWAETLGDPEVCIAVLDGPVDLSHPCFAGARLTVVDEWPAGEDLAAAHGTHVASVLFGAHGSAAPGVAPGCRGVLVPVFRPGPGGGVVPCTQIDLARAITRAVEEGAHVINISGGELAQSDVPHPVLANAVRLCADRGVLIVAAAGNDGCQCLHLPAAVHPALVVGAMDAAGEPLPFSNWGDPYQGRGVLAPGQAVPGAAPGGGTASRTGTSAAAPLVSGIVGLLLSRQRANGQTPDPYAVARALLDASTGCDEQPTAECRRLLAGRLNLPRVLAHPPQGGTVQMSDLQAHPEQAAPAVAAAPPEPAVQPSWSGGPALEAPPRGGAPEPAQNDGWQRVASVDTTQRNAWQAAAPAVQPSFVPAAAQAPAAGAGVTPSVCNDFLCGNKRFVYALGQIDYDFGTEANRDWFAQRVDHPDDPEEMLRYLGDDLDSGESDEGGAPSHAAALTWTLKLDATPIYAIQPLGPFAERAYAWLRVFLRSQVRDGVEMVSVPGVITGSTTLINGQTVPVIIPDHRGMYAWSVERLLAAALGESPDDDERAGLDNFLYRVYYELRNLGLTSPERALNYAATNAFQLTHVYGTAVRNRLELDTIRVRPSPVCRPGSDCWDVEISFFDPDNTNRASRVYRFTIDVSDVLPVSVGQVRSWTIR